MIGAAPSRAPLSSLMGSGYLGLGRDAVWAGDAGFASFGPGASRGTPAGARARNPKSGSRVPPGRLLPPLPEAALAARVTGPGGGGGGGGGGVMDLEEAVSGRFGE